MGKGNNPALVMILFTFISVVGSNSYLIPETSFFFGKIILVWKKNWLTNRVWTTAGASDYIVSE